MTIDEKSAISAAATIGTFLFIFTGNEEAIVPVVYAVVVPGWFQLLAASSILLIAVSSAVHDSRMARIISPIGTLGLLIASGLIVDDTWVGMRWLPLVTGVPFYGCALWRLRLDWAALRSHMRDNGGDPSA